jgi:hypothetical protein
MTAECTIRRASPADVSALGRLLSRLQAHYGSPDPARGAVNYRLTGDVLRSFAGR